MKHLFMALFIFASLFNIAEAKQAYITMVDGTVEVHDLDSLGVPWPTDPGIPYRGAGMAWGGSYVLDTNLDSTSSLDDSIPSARETKEHLDLKLNIADMNTVSPAVATMMGSADNAEIRTNTGSQAALISGTNIKTINSQSVLGSGNISISGGSGGITIDPATPSTPGDAFLNDTTHILTIASSTGVTAFTGSFTAWDTTPTAFSFTDQTDVALSTEITSAPVQVTGINYPTAVTSSAASVAVCTDTNLTNCGTFSTAPGNISNNQYLRARHTSSSSNSTAVNTPVFVGGFSDTFTSTTLAGASETYAFKYDADHTSGTHYAYLNSGVSAIAGTLTNATISTAHPVSGNGLLYDAEGEKLFWSSGVTGVNTAEGSAEIWVYINTASITAPCALFELYVAASGGSNMIRGEVVTGGYVYFRHEGVDHVVSMQTTAAIPVQTLARLRFRWSAAGNVIGVQVGSAGSWENDADADVVTALGAAVNYINVGDGVYNLNVSHPTYIDNLSVMSGYDTFNN